MNNPEKLPEQQPGKQLREQSESVKESKAWLAPLKTTFGESRGVQLLSAVLVLQLAVAGALLWRSSAQNNFAPVTQLVSLDPSTIDEIVIDDGKERVTLTRSDDKWHLNDEHETLAAADKIDVLVSSISDLKPGLPVASTPGSHQQLEVAAEQFQRRVSLKAGDETVADLYMGTSPGFRKSHIRQVDRDQVYAARINTFDTPADHDDWLDQNLLAFDNVTGVQSEGIELTLADEQWSIAQPQNQRVTHEVDQAAIGSFVDQLSSLRVNGFATPLEAAGPSDAEPADTDSETAEAEELTTHSITVAQNGTPVTLVLSKKGSKATIERSDVKGLFALPVATYESLSSLAVQQLVVEKNAEEPADGDNQPKG